ncbi:hypothetical protein IQ238_03355 [Pleurocapsales cyanobacterium LEGE 06147]|nr:hypothetical protein [Pleurocapsales cyanobacterium LEGE 06147]
MTSSTPKEQSIKYPQTTVERAKRALCCSPFKLTLFSAMGDRSIPLQTIAGKTGIERGYTQKLLTERAAEAELIWLIDVGLLRREVDGQGITDSFRLTPLGKQIIAIWESQGDYFPSPSRVDQIYNTLNRWLKWSR